MYYPKPRPVPRRTEYLDVFRGYNRSTRIMDGEFEGMENLSSDQFPTMAPRGLRMLVAKGLEGNIAPIDGMAVRGTYEQEAAQSRLLYHQGGRLIMGYGPNQHVWEVKTTPGRTQIVNIGDKAILFPGGVYVYPDLWNKEPENLSNSTSASGAKFEMCNLDGAVITAKSTQPTAPASPADGDYWIDTSGEKHTLNRYSAALGIWAPVLTVYVKISAPGIGMGFKDQDGIRLDIKSDNAQLKALNGYNVIWGRSDDHVIVVGILDKVLTADVSLHRELPDMDFVFECNNRLWGCKYEFSVDQQKMVNRIYCSARGDPKNWHRFSASADDSYFADVGTDGPFTGGCAFHGKPHFFKENCIHIVHGVNPPFTIETRQAMGVQAGCDRSVAVANEIMFYKSRLGVCAFDGSVPRDIGEPLGDIPYENACGGFYDRKYYLSMQHDGVSSLFVYDLEKRMWHREDDLNVSEMAAGIYHLYGVDADHTRIITLDGHPDELLEEIEEQIPWEAVTGDLGLSDHRQKYISRIAVRMELDQDSQVEISIRYDRRKDWQPVCVQRSTNLESFSVPIKPERCDHLQLRFKGLGGCRIYSIAKTIQKGSERT